jgi:hypothetical protein
MDKINVAKPMEQVEPVLVEIVHQVAGPSAEIEQVEDWGYGALLGWVIDFGNGLFLPEYMNEDGVRRHGGFGLPARDCESYGIPAEEHAANELLGTLNWTAFAGILCRTGRWKKDPRELVDRLLGEVKKHT